MKNKLRVFGVHFVSKCTVSIYKYFHVKNVYLHFVFGSLSLEINADIQPHLIPSVEYLITAATRTSYSNPQTLRSNHF